jgi:hypothetical protein
MFDIHGCLNAFGIVAVIYYQDSFYFITFQQSRSEFYGSWSVIVTWDEGQDFHHVSCIEIE